MRVGNQPVDAGVYCGATILATSQIRAVIHDAVTTLRPSGLNRAETTSSSCLIGLPIALPVAASQRRAVLSADAVTTNLPSELKWAELTRPSCCIGSPSASPVATFQSRAVLSADAVSTQ